MTEKHGVLMVCLGNICRSPIAEAVFAQKVKDWGVAGDFHTIDSAGTSDFHPGEDPDDRSMAVCRKHGVPISSIARQVEPEDFHKFSYILGMDENNVRNLERMRPRGAKATVALFGSFDDNKSIIDPYYGGGPLFERVYEQCSRYSEALLRHMGYSK